MTWLGADEAGIWRLDRVVLAGMRDEVGRTS